MILNAPLKLFLTFVTVFLLTVFSTPGQAGEKAADLRAKAQEFEKQGRYADAAEMHGKAADAEMLGVALSGFLDSQHLTEAHQTIANDLSHAGMDYYKAGEYARGIQVYERGLTVLREGNIERDIPLCLNSIAWGLFRAQRNEEGLKYLADAAKAAKKAGLDGLAADVLNDRGNALTSFGRYREAIPEHEEAQKLYKRLGDDNLFANMYNNIGQAYRGLGEYDKAIEFYKQAYTLHKSVGKDPEAALNMNNIGLVHESRGQYDRALRAYEKALEVYRQYKVEQEIPTTLNNIGNIYFAWALYDKALAYYEEALAQSRKLSNEASTATRLGSIGAVYLELGRYDDALKYFDESLALNRRIGRTDDAADTLNRIGLIHIRQGRQDKALSCFEEALAITKKSGNLHIMSTSLGNLGQLHFFRKEYERAEAKFRESLDLSRKIGNDEGAANMLYNIGRVRFETKSYDAADQSFRESVLLKEKLRRTAPGAARREYTAKQIAMYQYLTSAGIRQKNYSEAIKSIELGKAKFLAEQLAGNDAGVVVQAGDSIQRRLSDDTAVIMFANTNQRDKVITVLTRGGLFGVETANLDLYDSKWSKYSDETTAGLVGARNVRLVERTQKEARAVELKPACSCDAVINYYRTLLIASGQRGRGAAIRPRLAKTDEDEIRTLAKLLYRIFVKPVESEFKGKKKLIISTDGALGFLPFETLIDDSGKYLAETYDITYVQSMAVADLIAKRRYDEGRKPLLAFGGALYDTRDMKTAGDATSLSEGSFRGRYTEIGLGAWTNIPYTLKEVQAIARIVPGTDLYRGDQVTERRIKDLDAKGGLARYKVIHFATHGMVVPAYPELSALVLSQGHDAQGEDGYLRMEEIAKLRLRADFVNLSACDTGLGKLYEGEGVVSLAHAFLIAGANSVSVSLWQVADESTSKFMTGVYEQVFTKGWSYPKAIAEMKRRFIRGDYGPTFSAPYYWAPFVYYGL